MNELPRRLMYFGYYLRRMDWALLAKFMGYVRAKKGWSKRRQWWAILRDSLRFNISPLEYYQFQFFEQTEAEKAAWAGTGTMYEFQRQANPPGSREILLNKIRFYDAYKQFFTHELHSLSELRTRPLQLEKLLKENEVVVLKEAKGNCGAGVSFRSTTGMTSESVLDDMQSEGFDLIETFARQHPDLSRLSPSGVNTVRIFTQIRKNGEYEVLGCRLRISVDCPVDNLAAGNMAAPVDTDTGIVNGPGVFADITKPPAANHPITGEPVVGFQVPFWEDTLDLVRDASMLHPENRSIGWDVVITATGPGLIEGNHDWCKLVWQLPVKRGLKHLLDSS